MAAVTVPQPDLVAVQAHPAAGWSRPDPTGVDVGFEPDGTGLRVRVAALDGVARVKLRWQRPAPAGALVLGDAWERSYGELEWRSPRAERVLPWLALVHQPGSELTDGFGVDVRGGAFAFWQVDAQGVSLTLDLRSGGAAVRLGDRACEAATVRWIRGTGTPFDTQRELARAVCRDALAPAQPVVGANNWYYAYGKGFDSAAVVRDARTIAELADGHPVRPWGVVDDGWSPEGTADGRRASGGPWDSGRPGTFSDLPGTAAAIAAEGVRPGIWYRPLLRRDGWSKGVRGERDGGLALDPSSPEVLDLVEQDVARLVGWGFGLVKHDFSTYDLLGHWGPDMGPSPTAGPPLANPSVTTAEALVGCYRRLRRGAGDALVLGCNVVGHLAAGLVEAQRIGDDTSGVDWDRTRRVGVNTLAFRLAQHGALFAVDPDCVPCTPHTDWELNRRFLDLVARSGAVLFVSVDPRARTDRTDADLAAALRIALDGGTPGGVEPLDWLTSPTPGRWRVGSREVSYDWLGGEGADAFEPLGTATPQ
jgi:alpha-galactosidase